MKHACSTTVSEHLIEDQNVGRVNLTVRHSMATLLFTNASSQLLSLTELAQVSSGSESNLKLMSSFFLLWQLNYAACRTAR